jgi:DnaJ-class molecular chaperone
MKATLESSPEDTPISYRQVRCKICHGSGRDTSNSAIGVLCLKCDGTGWRMFPVGYAEKCPTCYGRGKDYRLSINGRVCPECDGFGEIKLV